MSNGRERETESVYVYGVNVTVLTRLLGAGCLELSEFPNYHCSSQIWEFGNSKPVCVDGQESFPGSDLREVVERGHEGWPLASILCFLCLFGEWEII